MNSHCCFPQTDSASIYPFSYSYEEFSRYAALTGVGGGQRKQLFSSSVFKFTFLCAHTGKAGSPQAGTVHCLCQQYIPVTVWLCSLCSSSPCDSRQRSPLLLYTVDFDLHTYCLPTTHCCRAWTQRARSPHGHATSPFVMATEEHMKCVLLVSQTQISPPGRSHHYSLQKQSTGFMLWWLPSNIRFQIKAEKGGSAEEVTEGLLMPFKATASFG